MSSKFFLCTQLGCNRKYKTEKKLIVHLQDKHQVEEIVLPDAIEVGKNEKIRDNDHFQRIQQTHQLIEETRQRKTLREKARYAAEERLAQQYGEQYFQEQEETLRIQQRVKENADDCAICFERPQNAAAVPCGHAYFCFVCLLNQFTNHREKGCPFCREKIDKVVKLFQ